MTLQQLNYLVTVAQTGEIIDDVANGKSEIGVIYFYDN